MKKNIFRTVIIICLLILFATIFGFSSQNREKSGNLSKKVTYEVTKNIESIQKLDKIEKENVLNKIEKFIRKMAHFTLYTLVGILMMSLMETYNINRIKKIGSSLGIGVLYASSDEIHQFFVPGRGPQVLDVLLDSSGVIVGILIFMAFFVVLKNILNIMKKKLKKKKNIYIIEK